MLRNLSFENVERLIQFSVSKRPGEIDIQGNIIAILTDQEIIFGDKPKDWLEFLYPQVDREIEINSLRDQILKISQHWQLEIKIMQSSNDLDIQTRNEFEIFLDLDQIGKENLLLRQKRDGDRFQPLGMTNGTIKMSDFFINEKLMKDARKKWPLLTNSAGEIIWIPGFRPGHNARVTTSSQNIVSFSITRINERNY
jgi:tRNA(Ile)-lysidine synthase